MQRLFALTCNTQLTLQANAPRVCQHRYHKCKQDSRQANSLDSQKESNLRLNTSVAPFGRFFPPWTEGSAHHLAARRRTPI